MLFIWKAEIHVSSEKMATSMEI